MAKSNALKFREKQIREGKFDAAKVRGNWGDILPVTKKNKTKLGSLTHKLKKHKKDHSLYEYDENGSFCFMVSKT
ncbi:hypothetical protein CVD28_08275 [Bacillus sp. M6-12]|uniref:hypothetical protein n=1 Tax=Bacillus sp. M6-12 TaxID=2054166 RepID=UPI000C7594BD|nr:hypothetical protein [Bacillus sp. M6-12]PLS18270.1 hypothetical protein CVD28_08275 [Bacillus sp. M6-12]